MADKRIMTPEEKALLQARHRQEEAEARNRKKERDARTHRLVQEGAILESIVPHIKEMDLDFHLHGHSAIIFHHSLSQQATKFGFSYETTTT